MLSRLLWLALLLITVLSISPAHPADRTIYRCMLGGVRTFSDRPCGATIEVHAPDVPSASTPLNQPTRIQGTPEASDNPVMPARRPSARSASPANHEDSSTKQCVRLDAELQRLTARMRTGYSAAEGERLRERQRAAKERRRDLQCR